MSFLELKSLASSIYTLKTLLFIGPWGLHNVIFAFLSSLPDFVYFPSKSLILQCSLVGALLVFRLPNSPLSLC